MLDSAFPGLDVQGSFDPGHFQDAMYVPLDFNFDLAFAMDFSFDPDHHLIPLGDPFECTNLDLETARQLPLPSDEGKCTSFGITFARLARGLIASQHVQSTQVSTTQRRGGPWGLQSLKSIPWRQNVWRLKAYWVTRISF